MVKNPERTSNTLPRALVLTAIPVEFDAVCRHLANPREEEHPEGTVYQRGLFTGRKVTWDVLVVEVGAGNNRAAAEAERAISYFRPAVALFVGVAGGIKDVAIGDVVAADKIYGYESGKAAETFQSRPDVGTPSYRLVQRAKAEVRSREWLNRLGSATPPTLPRAFVGAVAAGEKVVAAIKSEAYNLIKSNYGDALVVEMEGRGFLEAVYAHDRVSSLVIRGVSDLVEGKSAADASGSQELAARHASAFAFEVLSKLSAQEAESQVRSENTARPDLGRVNTAVSLGSGNLAAAVSSQGPIESEAVKLLVERFLSVFNNHGVLTNQIPRFVPSEFGLKLSDFRSQETVLNVLSDELLQWTVDTFGIRREWLEGCVDWSDGPTKQIYPDFDCYKNVQEFIDVAVKLRRLVWGHSEMFVLKSGELARQAVEGRFFIVMVLREVIGAVNRRQVYRYTPVTTLWNWGYWRTRYQAKAVFLICENLQIDIHGYDASEDVVLNMAGGRLFPESLLDKMGSYTWYPEDYVDLPDESIRAEEVDETERVREYIREERYLEYLSRKSEES